MSFINFSMTIKKAFFVGLSITGAIVGVGFASGREVVSFFARFGYMSILFCVLAVILLGLLSFLIFSLNNKHEDALVEGEKRKSEKINLKNGLKAVKKPKLLFLDRFHDIILLISQVVICSAMFAGFSSALSSLGLNSHLQPILKIALLVMSYFYILRRPTGVYVVNLILSLFMILSVFVLFAISFRVDRISAENLKVFEFPLLYMPMLFVGMNVFTVEPLLCEVGYSLNTKKEKILASSFIAIFVGLSLSLVCALLVYFGGDVLTRDMPMQILASRSSSVFGIIYSILLIFSIVTTLISTAYGASILIKHKVSRNMGVLLPIMFAFLFSFMGFAKIIDFVYPILGLVCIIFIFTKSFTKSLHT